MGSDDQNILACHLDLALTVVSAERHDWEGGGQIVPPPPIFSETKQHSETGEAASESVRLDTSNSCHHFNIKVTDQVKVRSKVKTSFSHLGP